MTVECRYPRLITKCAVCPVTRPKLRLNFVHLRPSPSRYARDGLPCDKSIRRGHVIKQSDRGWGKGNSSSVGELVASRALDPNPHSTLNAVWTPEDRGGWSFLRMVTNVGDGIMANCQNSISFQDRDAENPMSHNTRQTVQRGGECEHRTHANTHTPRVDTVVYMAEFVQSKGRNSESDICTIRCLAA